MQSFNIINSQNNIPQSPTILLVEDNSTSQMVHQHLLSQLGCQIDLADNATDAIRTTETNSYNAVLLDFHLPHGINGDAVIQQAIRAREQATQTTNPLPIIVVSADIQQPQLQACLSLGAHQVHEKPISLLVLGRALQACGIIDIQKAASWTNHSYPKN